MKTENFIYKNEKDFTGTLEERDQLLQQSLDRLKIKKAVKSIEHKTLFDYVGDICEQKYTLYRKPYAAKILNADTTYVGALVTFEDDSKKFYLWTYWGANYNVSTGKETKPAGYYYLQADSAGERHLKEVFSCWVSDKTYYKDISEAAGKDYYDFEGDDFTQARIKLYEYFQDK
jgi:hypothetical protein